MTAVVSLLLMIPLTSDQGWQILAYRGIPSHQVRFTQDGLTIEVKRSAAPILYPLRTPETVRVLRARGRMTGTLRVSADVQGQRGFDDYALRLGLVEVGQKRPGFFERRFAPAWLRTLFDLAPPGAGIEQVRFFVVGADRAQLGRQRRHPSSDLLTERIVAVPDDEGRFELHVELDTPVEVSAIWVSVDGDDTQSTFTIHLDQITLDTVTGDPAPGR